MRTITAFMFLIAGFTISAQEQAYQVSFDLTNVENDQLRVLVNVPPVSLDSIVYQLPKIVPGTYSISDFGRFVSDFTAISNQGDTLEVSQKDANRWMIKDATNLSSITYLIDDTFDKNEDYQDNYIFEPGGTSFEADRDVFVLNTFGIVGYLDDMLFHPYELTITKDSTWYGATSLQRIENKTTSDVFTASNYNRLADAPILYCEPDTAIKKIDNTEIIISVFSPNDKLQASEIMDNLDDLIEAQTNYLGGSLPVDKYAYLIYLLDYNPVSGGMGALEHSYSSLYTLPEAGANRISQIVRDVAAHEFLHIVTPLNIHSEQIHDFDYIEPKMSKHLWLYEGVTEYSSMHVQVRNGLYDSDTFLDNIKEKIEVASEFPAVSFTEMSENILDETFEPMYENVYYKGALIAMCLDLYLIKYSGGSMDLPSLLSKLSEQYGPNQPFEDDQLFEVITQMTFPEVGNFFQNHVANADPLPLQEVLSWAGFDYEMDQEIEQPTLGNIAFSLTEDGEIQIADVSDMNDFGRSMGYQQGDIVFSLNGEPLSLQNIQTALDNYTQNTQAGDKVSVVVLRDKKGKLKKKKLTAKSMTITTSQASDIIQATEPTEEQKKVQSVWLNGLGS